MPERQLNLVDMMIGGGSIQSLGNYFNVFLCALIIYHAMHNTCDRMTIVGGYKINLLSS